MFKNHAIAGSIIGGLPDTQRVLDFCHQHKIVPKIKMITSNDLDRVYEELNKKNDTILRYFFLITASFNLKISLIEMFWILRQVLQDKDKYCTYEFL